MKLLSRAALVLAANLIALSPAVAGGFEAGASEASLSWRLGFGGPGKELQTGYRLALGLRMPGLDDGVAPLADLDVSNTQALARFAGLPLYGRSWRLNQADGPADPEPYRKPFLARQWVWWTAGGLAVTAAALSGAGGNNEVSGCTGVCNQQGEPTGRTTVVTVDGDGDGDDPEVYVGCVDGLCAVCPNGDIASSCLVPTRGSERTALQLRNDEGLDEGTGGMGDLLAR